jgi:hypothetical protein
VEELPFNEYHTLTQLDPGTWSAVDLDDPEIALLAKRVATKPVRRLEPGELLPLLRRDLSLLFAVPLAMAKLEEDPFLRAATHPGDLLVAALEVDATFWKTHKPLWMEMMLLLGEAASRVERARESQELGDYYPEFVGEDFMAALLHFRGLHNPE